MLKPNFEENIDYKIVDSGHNLVHFYMTHGHSKKSDNVYLKSCRDKQLGSVDLPKMTITWRKTQ